MPKYHYHPNITQLIVTRTSPKFDGFLAPGHVSMVIGSEPYQELCDTYHKPFVITGFEPLDILQAIFNVGDTDC